MASKAPSGRRQDQLSAEALEISRLLLDFLNAAYASRNDVEDENRHGMSAHAVRAAIFIHQNGERSIGQLAAGLGISYGWASRVVDELEAAHYVIRERDPRDHRIVRIRLDPRAAHTVERAYRWREQEVMDSLEPLAPPEREAVRSFLRAITARVRLNQVDGGESGSRL